MIKLLICTPVLAVDDYCAELVAALQQLRQGGLEFTHLVVGPEKNRDDVARVFAPLQSQFLPERAGTRGVFDAVAQGYEHALATLASTHLAYINADDRLEPGFAAAVAVCKIGEKQLITGEVEWIGAQGQRFGRIPVWPWQAGSAPLFEAGIPPFTQQGAILSAEVWRETGGFDKEYKYIADSCLWHRIMSQNLATRVHVRKWVASYRIRPGQLSGNRSAVAAEKRNWLAGLTFKSAEVKKAIYKIGFRMLSLPRYVERVFSGKNLRVESAMQEGGF